MHPAIFYFNEVDSTNNEAKKLIEEENIKYGLVVSNYQSKGRGRFGNKWISQRGNFFSSFFFPVNNYSQVSQIQFEALKLVINVFSKYIMKNKLAIKYPNDILIKQKKISGILVESFKFKKKIYVILGIGINLIKNPSLKSYKTTSIYKEIGKKIDFFDFSEIIYKEMKVIFKCF